MAGAGYKLFNTGDVLTAAQVNTYLQEQTVMVFANSAARTTALASVLAEGMVTYLKDTDALEIYSGTAWVGYGSGDITGVTAGTGLSGGGTSGTVTVSLATPVAATNGGTAQTTYATGDLLYASAANTLTKLPIGSAGTVLTVSGGIPSWQTSAGDITGITTGTDSGLTGGVTSGTADLKLNLTFNAQTGTTYTLVAGDLNKYVTCSNASSITVTVPPSVFSSGNQIHIQQIGAGQVTFAQGSGVTITSTGATASAPKLRKQYSAATVICTGSNTFTIVGDLS